MANSTRVELLIAVVAPWPPPWLNKEENLERWGGRRQFKMYWYVDCICMCTENAKARHGMNYKCPLHNEAVCNRQNDPSSERFGQG